MARNENPKGAASTVSEARSAARGVRRAKKSSGSRGSATRPSRRRKPTSRTTAATARAATSAGATERSASCVMTKTSANKPSALLPAPARSYERRAGRGGSAATTRMAMSVTANTTGTLTRKIQRQFSASVTSPPSTSPTANPALAHAPKTPSARLRCSPSANVGDERDRGRHGQRRPDALQGPRNHEHGGPGRQAARQRHRAEERESEHEGAPPSHEVGHPAAEEQQSAVGQHVRVGDPRQPALADVEVRADARQRDLRDRQVERVEHDRGADHEENERPACARHPHDGYPARRTPSHTDRAVRHNPWL